MLIRLACRLRPSDIRSASPALASIPRAAAGRRGMRKDTLNLGEEDDSKPQDRRAMKPIHPMAVSSQLSGGDGVRRRRHLINLFSHEKSALHNLVSASLSITMYNPSCRRAGREVTLDNNIDYVRPHSLKRVPLMPSSLCHAGGPGNLLPDVRVCVCVALVLCIYPDAVSLMLEYLAPGPVSVVLSPRCLLQCVHPRPD